MLNSRLAVGVSQSGGMVALYDDPDDHSFERRLHCLFSFHYPDIIVKPSLALLRPKTDLHNSVKQLIHHLIPWSEEINQPTSAATGVAIPIVGCTVSGGMIHVYRICARLYALLLVLEDLLLDFEPTKPLLGSSKNFREWYCQLSGGEKATIHGDLVESFLRLSLEEQMAVVQDQNGAIKTNLMAALVELFKDDGKENTKTHLHSVERVVLFIKDILSGFERYR
jgi:hypothetical protein